MEPGVFAAIGTCFKFAEFAVRIAEVGTENEVFVRKIQVVRNDLSETERLLALPAVQKKLISRPGKLEWIRGAILSTKTALNEIGRWIERARGEQQALGTVKFETRVRWVFNDHEKLINRQLELTTCHLQLSTVLNFLIPLEEFTDSPEPPSYRDTTCFDDILSPRQKRQSVLNQPSLTGGNAVEPRSAYTSMGIARKPAFISPESPGTQMQYQTAEDTRFIPPYGTTRNNEKASYAPPSTDIYRPGVSSDYQGLASPLSPPLSPPPTYASATIQNSNLPSIAQTTTSASSSSYGDYFTATKSNSPPEISNTAPPAAQNHGNETKVYETWAYQATQPSQIPQELPGDTVSMMATNIQGPVNPFELFAGEVPEQARAKPQWDKASDHRVNSLTEAMGDCSFAAELPSDSSRPGFGPGPPPGYPRISPASTQALQASPMTYVSELPASIAKRRPVPSAFIKDSLATVQELPASPQNHIAVDNTNGSYASSKDMYTTQDPRSVYPPYSAPSNAQISSRHSTISLLSSPALSSASAAISPFSSPMVGHATFANPVERIVSPYLPNQSSQQSAPVRSDTTTSRRMQSQRTFMDMLGSIDRS
ncbi:hypothetical protein P154DRAFT_566001 [Amniculicola lignicola CBS 123094]|uniref:Uncharacterized protein n=1 Tax=Amniculicola lignicola CBS 123094 TaxID=1392246 RepID=A0A6A5W713_9PLEO|nr:hypothetical protein P154DRAFT_566001 [Amniculicola lignicola CBS 123094]